MILDKVAIITDSCADLTQEQLQKYENIFVLPLILRDQNEEYYDGVTIKAADVYEKQKTEQLKTSLPSFESAMELLNTIYEQGYTKVVAIMLSAGLSGTYNQMRMLAEDWEDKLELKAFDSINGSLGTGAIVLQTAQYIREGMSWEHLLEILPQLIANTYVCFSVDTLEYLQKGGRIGKVTAAAGTMLNLKPLLSFAGSGELVNVDLVRGRKLIQSHLIKFLKGKAGEKPLRYNLMVANGGAPSEGAQLKEKLAAQYPDFVRYYETEIGATLSVYIGPGVLGVGIQILPE